MCSINITARRSSPLRDSCNMGAKDCMVRVLLSVGRRDAHRRTTAPWSCLRSHTMYWQASYLSGVTDVSRTANVSRRWRVQSEVERVDG